MRGRHPVRDQHRCGNSVNLSSQILCCPLSPHPVKNSYLVCRAVESPWSQGVNIDHCFEDTLTASGETMDKLHRNNQLNSEPQKDTLLMEAQGFLTCNQNVTETDPHRDSSYSHPGLGQCHTDIAGGLHQDPPRESSLQEITS